MTLIVCIKDSALPAGVWIMAKKLYVGNLSYEVTDSDLSKMFRPTAALSRPRSSSTGTPADPRASASWK